MKLKKLLKEVKKKYLDLIKKESDTHYLSIGENCLTDNILDRHNLKSFSTPYSHGRSNLDYAIKLEKDNYQNLLSTEHLFYDYVGENKVVRNKHYSQSDDIYVEIHQNGFEFTHHDVMNNEPQRKSYERKILRMTSFDNSKKLKFVYHYRINKNKNLKLIINKAEEFLSYYQKKGIECEFIFFTQEIISQKEERKLIKVHDSKSVKGFILNTLEIWGGDDDDVFWAKKDDDLLKKMIKEIQ
ncbi:hypothetical protein DNU06_13445 [Putridiphycobacter roseus]|uniref:Papain-like cysteine peptidase n=1 Tax=Putridiphycobacter roseus TaxID=2219161 RepID=A0A2W1NKX2_9FLAO|nr:DUF1796 family putative cysteine peptidase [Putridiphycobacter roseus]PZE16312.1 hypothetical protein DNU06_13445 [Putridiphycobacter roseus]